MAKLGPTTIHGKLSVIGDLEAENIIGSMEKSVYDPTDKQADVFNMDNMVESSTAKIFTDVERTKLSNIEAGAQVNVATNLGYTRNESAVTVTSSTGTNTSIPSATTGSAGVFSAADKSKLDDIQAGAQVNVNTNLGSSTTATTVNITSSTGNNTSISGATTSQAGVMVATDKTKLNGIEAGAQVNVPTNISINTAASTVSVVSSTGSNGSIPAATTSTAGVLSSADKTKLNGIAAGAQVNTVNSVAGKTGNVTLTKSDVGLGNVVNVESYSKDEADKQFPDQLTNTLAGIDDITNMAGNTGSSDQYPHLTGFTIGDEDETTSFTAAVNRGVAVGARLPTIDELEADLVAGTGSLYDNVICWSSSQSRPGYVWANYGRPSNFNGKASRVELSINSDVAATRYVVNNNRTFVPYSDNADKLDGFHASHFATTSALNDKVDKVSGKQLSTEDYTTAEKNKLSGIEAGAQANVATNLGTSRTATSVTVTSSTGSNVALPAATTTQAGVFVAADKVKLNGITAGAEPNVPTNISVTTTASVVNIVSSTGSNGQIAAATTSNAGVMSSADKVKLNGITAGAEPNVPTNLDTSTNATTVTVTSSTGNDATLPAATTTAAGVMIAADKVKLDSVTAGAEPNVNTNLSSSTTATTVTVTSSTGNNATLPAATTSAAGVMIATDKAKLNGIEAGAQANVATNLGSSRTATTVTVTSSTGNNVSLAGASTSAAGVMVAADKTKLNGIEAGAQVNTVDSVAGKTGVVSLVKGDVGLGNVDNTSDANKPISTATATALSNKQDTLVSGDNIATINGNSILAGGNITTPNTTYSAMSVAEINAGTATNNRSIRPDRLEYALGKYRNTAADLGGSTPSDMDYPTQLAVKTYVDQQAPFTNDAVESVHNLDYFTAQFSDKYINLGNSGTAITVDASQAGAFEMTLTGNCTVTITGANAVADRTTSFTLRVNNDATANRSITLTGGTFIYPGGAVNRTTLANRSDVWFFTTSDGGATWIVNIPLLDIR